MSGTSLTVLLAGGEGRRLRPLTGPARPKPCLRVVDEKSLLERAYERALALSGAPAWVWAVAAASQRANLSRVSGLFGAEGFVAEPAERNTAAALALACAAAETKLPDAAPMAVMPSDHAFDKPELFLDAARRALAEAEGFDGLVLLGTPPRQADPHYGYIQPEGAGREIRGVARFIEKPPLRQAERCMREGWLWNLGVFVFRVGTALKLFERHAPFYLEAAREALAGNGDAYTQLAPEPFDRVVVEHSPCRVVTVAPEAGWFDLGTWASMREYLERRTGRGFATDDEACSFLLDANP